MRFRNIFAVALAAFIGLQTSAVFAVDAAYKIILTSASPTACTSLYVNGTGGGYAVSVVNANVAAQTVTISLFDEGTSPSCSSADQIYPTISGASQVVKLDIPLSRGLAYTLSAAPANNIVVTWR